MKPIIDNFKDCICNKYMAFDGRADRAEFWYFVLANFVVSFVLGLVLGLISQKLSTFICGLYSLGILLPSLAVGARRLHDTNRSGWLQLLGLIPFIGIIILIIFWIQQGTASKSSATPPAA